MDPLSPPDALANLSFYSAHFTDLALWEPFVRRVAAEQGFDGQVIRAGFPGTYPTFLVDLGDNAGNIAGHTIVVKFFGPLFDGEAAYQVELAMGGFLDRQSLSLRSPRVLANGRLSPTWTYILFEFIPGASFNQVRTQLSVIVQEKVARQMGKFMMELHQRTAIEHPIDKVGRGWDDFTGFLRVQRETCLDNHARWQDLPAHLLREIPAYLPQIEQLLDLSSAPHLIHADLTGDHLLGSIYPDDPTSRPAKIGDWESRAIIDWGDCRVGNILYELVALHIDLFRADQHLLRMCLEEYGLPDFCRDDFARKAFSMTLLHQFPMPASVYAPYQSARSLQEIAEHIFGVA